MTALRRAPQSLAIPIGVSAALHAGLAVWAIAAYGVKPPMLPPIYRVELIAAPPGERAAGVVTEAPAPEVPTRAPAAPERAKAPPKAPPLPKARPKAAPKLATPNVTAKSTPVKSAAPPKAGGGPEGGTGTDVAQVKTAGIDFPFPGYLQNVVRRVALNFTPPAGTGALSADVMFVIRRDGTVSGVRILTNSGSYVFDLACRGAIEAAAKGAGFGALPTGFSDDALPVIFSFDPRKMK